MLKKFKEFLDEAYNTAHPTNVSSKVREHLQGEGLKVKHERTGEKNSHYTEIRYKPEHAEHARKAIGALRKYLGHHTDDDHLESRTEMRHQTSRKTTGSRIGTHTVKNKDGTQTTKVWTDHNLS